MNDHGVLIFAHDTDSRSYGAMAALCARFVRAAIDAPIALACDASTEDRIREMLPDGHFGRYFSTVVGIEPEGGYRIEDGASRPYLNLSRRRAIEISPWKRTLMLDADYLLLDGSYASSLYGAEDPVLFHREAITIGDYQPDPSSVLLPSAIPACWATAMVFDKSGSSRALFDVINVVIDNYDHYASVYNIDSGVRRIDVALTIADIIVNGGTPGTETLPGGPLLSMGPTDRLLEIRPDRGEILCSSWTNSKKMFYRNMTKGVSLHCTDKIGLGRIAQEILDA